MSTRTFHERPLVIFTTLAILGAGLLTAPLAALFPTPISSHVASGTFGPTTLLGTLLLAAGLLISLAHLGRPLRAPLALARFGRSRLSTEIVAVSAVLAAALVIMLVPGLPPGASLVPAVLALVFLVALGRVYDLPGQDVWRGAAAWTPLTMGVWVGAIAATAAGVCHPVLAWLAVLGDISVVAASAGTPWRAGTPEATHGVAASIGMQRRAGTPAATHETATGRKARPTRWLRLALADILPAVLLAVGLPIPALAVLAVGVLADRISFYTHASQHTTEAEIEQIEALME
jgi:DMSO reductase anchor subunit